MTRVAIVTGGTRGIGEAISLALEDLDHLIAQGREGHGPNHSRMSSSRGNTAGG